MDDADKEDNVPLCSLVSQRGIKTSADYADFMAGLMDDVVQKRVTPDVANAACKAGSSLLHMVRMQLELAGGRDPIRIAGSRIGETERTKLSSTCPDCKFPRDSQNHLKECRKGLTDGG